MTMGFGVPAELTITRRAFSFVLVPHKYISH